MKKLAIPLVLLASSIALSSCGVNSAMISSYNLNNTQVQLGSNNFKFVEHISGSADVSYVLIFGGLSEKQLFDNAYAAMMKKADLANGSRAITNVVTEEHVGGVPPFYYTRTVTVSGNVIEFTR